MTENMLKREGRLARAERAVIVDTLTETAGNVLQSARLLGCTANGLRKKLERLGIDLAHYRNVQPRQTAALNEGAREELIVI